MAVATRRIFAGYQPAPLNDLAAPPFPGREADDEDDTQQDGIDLEWERPKQDWAGDRAGAAARRRARAVHRRLDRLEDGRLDRRRVPAAADHRRCRCRGIARDGRAHAAAGRRRARRARCCASTPTASTRDDMLEAAHALQRHRRRAAGPADREPCLRTSTRCAAARASSRCRRWRRRSARVMLADLSTPTLVDGLLERRLATVPSHDVPVDRAW